MRKSLFILVFSLDVTVRASGLGLLKEPVEEPNNCIEKSVICTLGTYKGTKFQIEVGETKIILGDQTSLTRMDRGRYVLLDGSVWVRAEDEVIIESEFGNVTVYHGEALVSRSGKKVTAKSLAGKIKIFPKGAEALDVERGFENSLFPVGKNGKAQTGIPQLIDLQSCIKELGDLFTGTRQEFASVTAGIFEGWPDIVEKASSFHGDLAKRTVASDAEANERLNRRRRAWEAEKRRLNNLYREKTLGE